MKSKIFALLIVLSIIVGVLASCGGGGSDKDKGCKHVDKNDDGVCDKADCGADYDDGHDVHVDADDNGKCDVAGCNKNYDDGCNGTHVDKDDNNVCDKNGCNESCDDGHDKHFDANDDLVCDFDGCDEPCSDGNEGGDGTCDHEDADDDWYCDYCGENYDDGDNVTACNHRDANDDMYCDYCSVPFQDGPDSGGIEGGNDDKVYKVTWDTTTLIFQLTENSNNQELPSTCKRYMAGEEKNLTDFGDIDRYITERNTAAEEVTNVDIMYTYVGDTSEYGWGQNIDRIFEEVRANSSTTPDIYCNFVYDMVATSIRGSFANLKSQARGDNFFEFAVGSFEDTGKDYMYEYMRSLTLSKNKMYCLSSDYFTDMVRAFFVVPVNISVLSSITVDQASKLPGYNPEDGHNFNSDRDGDGDFDVDDFYDLVWDYDWNYETLADFSNAVYQEGNEPNTTSNENGCLHDTLGFAISNASGLSASGMLYTTTVEIIARDWDDASGDYIYAYPKTNDDLYTFCENITNLFANTPGVIAINNTETLGYGTDSLLAIRSQFVSDKVLFGGVICLGSLEYDVYTGMAGGFGIVPVPLYRTINPDTELPDKYQTQIHNLGRVGAISDSTKKFSQCTAFLDYVSLNSNKILNEYYNYKLQYDIAGGGKNAEMLEYIRENVRSSFDKAYEDAIGRYFSNIDPTSEDNKWHKILMDNKFQVNASDMQTFYDSLIGTKIEHLESIQSEFFRTPD